MVVGSLTACGGGGSDPDGADAIDRYLGTFRQLDCTRVAGVIDQATGEPLHVRAVTTYTKAGADRAQARDRLEVYPQPGCLGPPLATVVTSGQLVIVAARAGAGGADQVTRSTCGDYFPEGGDQEPVVNGVVFRGYATPAPQAWKDVFLMRGDELHMGDFRGGVDAAGYPLGLDALPGAAKE